MDIKSFKDILFLGAKSLEMTDFELFYLKNQNSKVNIFQGEVEKYQNNSSEGVSFRGTINGKTGFAYSEKIDKESADFLLQAVIKNSLIMDMSENEIIYEGNENYPNINLYSDNLKLYDNLYKTELGKKLEKAAFNYDKRIVSVETCFVGSGEGQVYMANSKGLELSEKSNYAVIVMSVTAEENGVKKTGSGFWQGKDFGPVDYVKIAENICDKALSSLGGEKINKGNWNVVLKNEAFADILTTFMGCFFAENAQKGFSLLKDKTGEKIASDCITIKDLPLLENGFASCNFDSEGVASFNKTIIDKGVLKTLLYNLKSAEKEGVKSTGNGFKSSFKSSVSTSATNFVVENGNIDFDNLITELDEGLIITNLAGLHSGAEPISGNFSLAASGFFVENGKIVKPIEQITVSGNFFDILKNIEKIANDMYFDMAGNKGAVICPSVLVKNISVAS